MRSTVAVVMVVLVTLAALLTQAQELKYPEREVVAGLAAQILRVARGPVVYAAVGPQKSNAELINSLLGIPKDERRRQEVDHSSSHYTNYGEGADLRGYGQAALQNFPARLQQLNTNVTVLSHSAVLGWRFSKVSKGQDDAVYWFPYSNKCLA